MTRSSNINETPSKTALKKAKRAATKAKQYLTEELSTATDTNTRTPGLDAVDASPVRIPRKYEPTPVSIPTLPVLPALVIPAKIPTVPPATVVILAQPFTAQPFQLTTDTLCAHLPVPTIRSRLDYERLPTKFTYLIDVKDCSSEDEMRMHIKLLSENRRQRRRLARKIKELAAKDETLKAKKPEE